MKKFPRVAGVVVAVVGSIVAAVWAYYGTASDLDEFMHGRIPGNELAARSLIAATTGLAVPLGLGLSELLPEATKGRPFAWAAAWIVAVLFGVFVGVTLGTSAALPAAIGIPTLVFGTLAFKDGCTR